MAGLEPRASTEEEIVFPIEGMSCAACRLRVTSALEALEGVHAANVNLLAHRASVRFDPRVVTPRAFVAAIDRVGFDAALPLAPVALLDRTREELATRRRDVRELTLRASLAVGVATFAMLAGGHGFGVVSHAAMPFVEAVVAAASVAVGLPIFRRGLRELAARAPGMDALVTLGSMAALGLSAGAWLHLEAFAGQHHVDGVPTLVAALLVGRALEARAKGATLVAQTALAGLLPSIATIVRGGESVNVPTRELLPGDLVRVRAGESFPGDGSVECGESDAYEAPLTGEARPVRKGPGDRVLGGTRNGLGELVVRLDRVGDATAVGCMLHTAELAQRDRGALENLAERAIRPFVPGMLFLSAVTALAWAVRGGPSAALLHGANVLLVACPCALGLAIPAALTVAIGRASHLGLLVRRGASLEAAARITHACFDKTGTLTSGRMRIVGVEPAPGVGEAQLREAAAIAEDGLDHPIAKALQIHSLSSTDWSRRVVPGEGVIATRGPETIVAGTLPFVCPERAPAVTPETDRGTTIAVARSDRFLGVLTVGDELRTGARPLVEALRRAGVTSLVLTGDASSYANVILAPLAIDVHARLKPEQKQAIIKGIRDARPGSHVLFVGDGINDAPALASADVSIAMASGTDVARAAGDVIVLHDEIASVATFLSLSRATVRTMRRNLAWAVVYNALALPVAAGLFENFGIAMTPTIAGAAMAASSLGVLAQSLALRFVPLDAPRSTPNTSTRPSDAPAGCAASPHPPRAES